jgi:CubicO group peptidase (beta-lactamase class C family)
MNRILINFSLILSVFCVVFFISLTITGCAGISPDIKNTNIGNRPDIMADLVGFIDTEMKTKKIEGLSIAVADSKGLLWTEGFGTANRKNDEPFTDITISNIGSVSKLITATAIMSLVEKNLIDLDVPVSKYIPEFNPRGTNLLDKPITVRMLLNHESGLESDAFHDFFLGYETPEDYLYSYRRALEAVNQSGIVRNPYEVFSYCNLGYSLLGIIVERVQGGNFQEAVKALVFDPLGMDDSTFILDEVPVERMAMGYLAGKPEKVPYIRDMPAGSLNSSARDMGAFLQSMLASYNSEGGLFQPGTIREMFKVSNENVANDLDFKIGLTWWVVDLKKLPGEYIVGHGGDLPPYHAMALILPERDLSIFIMVNSVDGVGSFSLTDIISETVRSFVKIKEQSPVQKAPAESPIIEIPESIKADLPGYYASSAGLSEIKLSGNKFKMFTFNKWFDVYYHADNTLTLGYKLMGIISLKLPVFDELSVSLEDIKGAQAINLRIQGILIAPSVRIEPLEIDPVWLARSGKYENTQAEIMPQYTDFKIELDKKSGFLCIFLKSAGEWSKFPLETIDSENAQLMGIGRGLGGVIQAKTSYSGETLSFQNFELRRK